LQLAGNDLIPGYQQTPTHPTAKTNTFAQLAASEPPFYHPNQNTFPSSNTANAPTTTSSSSQANQRASGPLSQQPKFSIS